jgi:hypothetical protein
MLSRLARMSKLRRSKEAGRVGEARLMSTKLRTGMAFLLFLFERSTIDDGLLNGCKGVM